MGYRLQAQVDQGGIQARRPVLHLLLRYTQALITQMAQTAVCNRHHSLDQQLCRWLLLSLDRLRGNELVMTQELIANMLGVRREGVTEAAGKLQKAGLIQYRRGRITVLDRRRPGSSAAASATRWSRRNTTACCRLTLATSIDYGEPRPGTDSPRRTVDVRLGQRLRGRGHVAIEVEAGSCLEAAQLRPQIVRLLTDETRNVLMAYERRAMARRAIVLLGEAPRRPVLFGGSFRAGSTGLP